MDKKTKKSQQKNKRDVKSKEIITIIGDTTLDIITERLTRFPEEDSEKEIVLSRKIGGQAAHTAIGLSLLGIKTRFITRVGEDELGNVLIKKLREFKNIELDVKRKGKTAISTIINKGNRRTILNDPGANKQFKHLKISELKKIKTPYLFIGGAGHLEIDINKISRFCKKQDITLLIDIGGPKLTKIPDADYLILNKTELKQYFPSKTISQALKILDKKTALHLGKEGSLFYDPEKKSDNKNSKTIKEKSSCKKLEDTTGAGDLWNAAFIEGIINRNEKISGKNRKNEIRKILKKANSFCVNCLIKQITDL